MKQLNISLVIFLCAFLVFSVYGEETAASGTSTKIKCTKPNEHYECGSACQTTCKTLGQDCSILNVKCNDACYCNDGYARDGSGKCIPVNQC